MSRRLRASLLASCSLTALLVGAQPAAAATVTGYAIDRFEPFEPGNAFFTTGSLAFDGKAQPAAGLTLDWGYKPQEVRDKGTGTLQPLVENQVAFHIGAAFTFAKRVQIGLSIPVYAVNSGQDVVRFDGDTYRGPSGANLGDVRLGATVRLVGEPNAPFRLGFGARVWIPSGKRDDFTGDGKVRFEPRFDVAGDVGSFVYAARVGFLYRGLSQSYVLTPVGHELTFGASAGVKVLDGALVVGPELSAAVAVRDTGAIVDKNVVPANLLIGGHYTAGDFRFGLGAGPGLSHASGTAAFRVLASFEWAPVVKAEAPPPPPKDSDGDGIVDLKDACPTVPGVVSADPKKNGCPPDRDGDGIVDDKDACPDVKGVASDDPKKNGCPADRDEDGIADDVDACPDVKGVASDDPKRNGCPPDRDGDGILDDQDACPDVAGPPNADPKKNGCPKVAVMQGQIRIFEQVKFKTASAEILKESDEILDAVAKTLKDHPEIKHVRVEGHTDNQGNAAYNKGLSQRRAESVMAALVKRGIDRKRLEAKGWGQEKPVDSNANEPGRQNNRRVEFHIVDESKPSDAPKPPAAPVTTPKAPATTPKK